MFQETTIATADKYTLTQIHTDGVHTLFAPRELSSAGFIQKPRKCRVSFLSDVRRKICSHLLTDILLALI